MTITPCRHICKLENGICIGCLRSIEEIANWSKLTLEEKLVIIKRINKSMKEKS